MLCSQWEAPIVLKASSFELDLYNKAGMLCSQWEAPIVLNASSFELV
jgi:hypothetical protein